MTTPTCSDHLSSFSMYACSLCMFILGSVCPGTSAVTYAQGANVSTTTTDNFFCRAGYEPDQCDRHIAELQAVLLQYSAGAPENWNWVIVRSEDWQPLIRSLRLHRRSPAFTALAERETFLEDALFFSQSKRTNQLAQDLHTPMDQLLSFAVSHELGHAICHGGDEATANRVAQQIRNRKHLDCGGNMVSLTPIEELYLHRQSPGFPRLR